MDNASLTISLPKAMKKFITARVAEGSFSTPSEYIRSLIRCDQEKSARGELEAFLRGALRGRSLPKIDDDAWRAIENILLQHAKPARQKARVATG